MEGELNGPLFRRERSKTHLTELGRMMLPHLQATLAAAEAAKTQARSFHKKETGELSIGVCSTVSPAIVARLLANAANAFFGLEITVSVEQTAKIEEGLGGGAFDAAVLAPASVVPDRFDLLRAGCDYSTFGPLGGATGVARIPGLTRTRGQSDQSQAPRFSSVARQTPRKANWS